MLMPTVLVADDEKNILQLARMYLQAEGFTVETAGNGREALDKVRPHIDSSTRMGADCGATIALR